MEDIKQKLAKSIIAGRKREENKKFGEFIVQSNEIQFYLSNLLLFRSSYPDKKYREDIERVQFGSLINLFCACAKRETGEAVLIPKLREYIKQRNKLAHKMYTVNKLTKKDCEIALSEGEKILKGLNILMDKEIDRFKNKKQK
ncbi:MAG: hypothetical protein PHQ20_02980 [Candidatus Moranbacteria bacterium]|nr:hypothetical protein [Candidatus Moranbacteria bacterium]